MRILSWKAAKQRCECRLSCVWKQNRHSAKNTLNSLTATIHKNKSNVLSNSKNVLNLCLQTLQKLGFCFNRYMEIKEFNIYPSQWCMKRRQSFWYTDLLEGNWKCFSMLASQNFIILFSFSSFVLGGLPF